MTDRVALLRAVRVDPFDLHARAVYADYLAEHGDAGDRLDADYIHDALRGSTDYAVDAFARACARIPGDPEAAVRYGFAWKVEYATLDEFLAAAPALFAAEPVVVVRVGDRRPVRADTYYCWWYWRDTWGEADELPGKIFRRLPGGRGRVLPHDDGTYYRAYPSRAAADADLSAALVNHGRRLAGLDPLPDETLIRLYRADAFEVTA